MRILKDVKQIQKLKMMIDLNENIISQIKVEILNQMEYANLNLLENTLIAHS